MSTQRINNNSGSYLPLYWGLLQPQLNSKYKSHVEFPFGWVFSFQFVQAFLLLHWNHLQILEDKMVQKNYDCDLCTSSFKGMEDLFSHVADAHKKHPCDMCEKVFLKKESLESHCKVVHHLKYECDLCNSSFNLRH